MLRQHLLKVLLPYSTLVIRKHRAPETKACPRGLSLESGGALVLSGICIIFDNNVSLQ